MRLLENHPYSAAYLNRVHIFIVDVFAVIKHCTRSVCARNKIVHTVEGAQDRAFAASGWTDHCSDLLFFDLHIDITYSEGFAIIKIEFRGFNSVGVLIYLCHFSNLITIAQENSDRVERKQDNQQHNNRGCSNISEFILWAGGPLVDLDRQGRKFREGAGRIESDECGSTHHNQRGSLAQCTRDG